MQIKSNKYCLQTDLNLCMELLKCVLHCLATTGPLFKGLQSKTTMKDEEGPPMQ